MIHPMDISAAGLAALALREGVKTAAYRDTVGVWTIGVGHAATSGSPPVPCAGMVITHDEALALFHADLAQYVGEVNRCIKVPCTQNQFDAMVSLCFNIGVGGFAGSSVAKMLNLGNVEAAANDFLLWDHPADLLERRKSEKAQFLSGAEPILAEPVPVPPAAPMPPTMPAVAPLVSAKVPPLWITRDIQAALKSLGFQVAVDDKYGPETRQAVRNFQTYAGVPVDGICGPDTRAALRKELARVS